MSRVGAVGLVALLLVAGVAPAPGLAAPSSTADPGPNLAQAGNQSFDSTEFRITVYANGSARWTFLFKQGLANQSERQDFEEYAARFNSTETELYTDFQRRARALVADGSDATGRSMNASDFAKNAETNAVGNLGLVRMSFTWSAFAAPDGDEVVVGDVFEGGFYIASDQRLVISRGPDLVFRAASPRPLTSAESLAESDSLTWQGERSFVDNRPRVRLGPPRTPTPSPTPGGSDGGAPPTTGGNGSAPGDGGAGDGGTGDGSDSAGFLPVLGLGVLLLVGLGAALAYQAGALPGVDSEDEAAAGTTADAGSAASAGSATAGAAAGGDDDAEADPEPAVPAEELLSDDERVMKLLDENGGRMKQVNIVEETGWSKSKVSMLLSDMEEEEQISKLRVGRENIISKKGMEPDAAGSPFEDDE